MTAPDGKNGVVRGGRSAEGETRRAAAGGQSRQPVANNQTSVASNGRSCLLPHVARVHRITHFDRFAGRIRKSSFPRGLVPMNTDDALACTLMANNGVARTAGQTTRTGNVVRRRTAGSMGSAGNGFKLGQNNESIWGWADCRRCVGLSDNGLFRTTSITTGRRLDTWARRLRCATGASTSRQSTNARPTSARPANAGRGRGDPHSTRGNLLVRHASPQSGPRAVIRFAAGSGSDREPRRQRRSPRRPVAAGIITRNRWSARRDRC